MALCATEQSRRFTHHWCTIERSEVLCHFICWRKLQYSIHMCQKYLLFTLNLHVAHLHQGSIYLNWEYSSLAASNGCCVHYNQTIQSFIWSLFWGKHMIKVQDILVPDGIAQDFMDCPKWKGLIFWKTWMCSVNVYSKLINRFGYFSYLSNISFHKSLLFILAYCLIANISYLFYYY